MYQPPPESQKKEQMWSLPFSVFSLARGKPTQILNDPGIVLEQSDPTVHSILRMLPTTCRGSRVDQGMDGMFPALSDLEEDKEINTV